jgi:hypothetical protein
MSADLEQLTATIDELKGQRDGLVAARTKESTAEAARAFLEAARARSEGVGGLVVGGHAVGQPLDDVLRAFLLSDPKLEGWLVERAEQFAELTAKAKAAQLKKLDGEIAKVQGEARDAAKAEALAAVEAQYAGEAV